MILLAVETSVHACSVALHHQGQIICDEVEAPRQQTQLLLPMIETLLARLNLGLQDVTHLAYSAGPGAFSGVRLGAAATQGLAVALNCPLVAVSSLEVLAYGIRRKYLEDRIYVVTDARMNEVYAAAFVWEHDVLHRQCEDRLCKVEDLPRLDGCWFLAGNGVPFLSMPIETHGIDQNMMPSAYDVAIIAARQIGAGCLTRPEHALPVYLRNDVWKKLPGRE